MLSTCVRCGYFVTHFPSRYILLAVLVAAVAEGRHVIEGKESIELYNVHDLDDLLIYDHHRHSGDKEEEYTDDMTTEYPDDVHTDDMYTDDMYTYQDILYSYQDIQ